MYYSYGQGITAKGRILQQGAAYYSKRQSITDKGRVLQKRTEYCSKGQRITTKAEYYSLGQNTAANGSLSAKGRFLQLRSKDIILEQGAGYYKKGKVLQLSSQKLTNEYEIYF